MISVPEASWASRMTSIEEYLPVPTISRDENSLPPRTRFVSYIRLPSPHGAHNLDLVAFRQRHRRVRRLGRDLAVDGDRRVLALDVEQGEQALDGEPGLDIHRLAVDVDLHRHKRPLPSSRVRPRSLPPPCSLRRHYPDQVRGVPGRTRFSGILPPRRRGGVYTRALRSFTSSESTARKVLERDESLLRPDQE